MTCPSPSRKREALARSDSRSRYLRYPTRSQTMEHPIMAVTVQVVRTGDLIARNAILKVPPSRIVTFLGTTENVLRVYLHWLGDRSRPCLGRECPYHQHPISYYGYAPVELLTVYRNGDRLRELKILPLTNSMLDLTNEVMASGTFEIARLGNLKNGKMVMRPLEAQDGERPEPFDVWPTLLRCWGLPPNTKRG